MIPLPPRSTLFPYTTLFRSRPKQVRQRRSIRAQWTDPMTLLFGTPSTHYPSRRDFLRRTGSGAGLRSEEHTSELQSRFDLVCRLLLEKKNNTHGTHDSRTHS